VDGRAAPTATVTLYSKTDHPAPAVASAAARSDGGFVFSGVLPGSYLLVARTTSDPVHLLAAVIPVEVKDKHVDGLKLELQRGREVTALVSAEGRLRPSGLFVSLASPYLPGRSRAAQIQNDETKLVFQDVLPLLYTLSFTNLPYNCHCYVKSTKYGGQEIPEGGVDPTTGAPLEIVLSPTAAVLEGTVVDAQGKPAAGAAIAVLVKDGPLSGLKTGVADANGKFVFDKNAPGEYEVLAWDDADLASLYQPGFLKEYEARAKLVNLPPSGRATVQVTALPAK
jgi:hypothetical protein